MKGSRSSRRPPKEVWPPRLRGDFGEPHTPHAVDRILVAAILGLGALGVLNLLSLSERELAVHQAACVLLGLILMLVLARWRGPERRLLGRGVYAIAVLLLLSVVVGGTHAFGARRWLSIGSVVFQPSELAKLGLLLVLAEVLGAVPAHRHRLLAAVFIAAVPIGLTLVEPDLSTAALLAVIAACALVLARVRLRHIVGIVAVGALLLIPAEHLLRPYQSARLHAFLNGGGDVQGTGWSVLQAHIAIGSGGLSGASVLPRNLLSTFLPARETDLAFASIIEQRGLLAGAAVLACAAVVVWRLVVAAGRARTPQGALIASGLAALTGVEVLINVGGNLGLLPLAGVPCPLLSAGGTATVVHLAALGLVFGEVREAQVRQLWQMPRWRRRRPRLAALTALVLSVGLVALGVSAAQLQRTQGSQLRTAAVNQATRTIRVPAERGLIVDRHGAVLASDVGTSDVMVIPDLIEAQADGVQELATMLGQTSQELLRRLARHDAGIASTVAIAVPAPVAARIQALGLPGVLVVATDQRRYPVGPLLAPLLGFAGIATPDDVAALGAVAPGTIVGRAGLEREYDHVLRGLDGQQSVIVDATGRVVGLTSSRRPVTGGTLQLSVDLGLQQAAAAALSTALQGVPGQPRGDEGTAVVMDAQTGQILAMVSLPAYDDNIFGPPIDLGALARAWKGAGDPFLEHATQTALTPGSTFKLVLGAADAATGIVPPQRIVPTGAAFKYGNVVFHNWEALPPQSLPQAIAWSNDVYFYKLALALGPERIAGVARQLGVGVPSGIDLPGEVAGIMGTPESVAAAGGTWYAGSTVILGIGQGAVAATPLQVTRWTAGLANGAMVTPSLGMDAVAPGADTVVPLAHPAPQPLSFARSLGPVRDGMRRAVLEGTGTQLLPLHIDAGGKTGTAEDPSTPSGGADAWFTAAAPMNHPEVAVTVTVRGGGEGYYTAEPAVQSILSYWLAHKAAILSTTPPAAASNPALRAPTPTAAQTPVAAAPAPPHPAAAYAPARPKPTPAPRPTPRPTGRKPRSLWAATAGRPRPPQRK